MGDCRNEGEASVKVNSPQNGEVARKTSHRLGRLKQEVGTVKVSK